MTETDVRDLIAQNIEPIDSSANILKAKFKRELLGNRFKKVTFAVVPSSVEKSETLFNALWKLSLTARAESYPDLIMGVYSEADMRMDNPTDIILLECKLEFING